MYHSSPKPGFPDSSAGKESTCNAGDPGWIPGLGRSAGEGIDRLPTPIFLGFPCGSAGKESACDVGDLGLIPGLGRFSGEGKSHPLQYCGLENSTDCIVHGIAKSRTRLSIFHFPQSQLPILLTDAPKDMVISTSDTDEPGTEGHLGVSGGRGGGESPPAVFLLLFLFLSLQLWSPGERTHTWKSRKASPCSCSVPWTVCRWPR